MLKFCIITKQNFTKALYVCSSIDFTATSILNSLLVLSFHHFYLAGFEDFVKALDESKMLLLALAKAVLTRAARIMCF